MMLFGCFSTFYEESLLSPLGHDAKKADVEGILNAMECAVQVTGLKWDERLQKGVA